VICELNKPRGILICILVLVVLGFTTYSFVLEAPFKTMDDNVSIVKNSDIQDLSNVKKIFTSSFFGDNHYYRPLVSLSYMLEYHFFGLNPFYYNLTNVVLHLAISVSVFFLIHLLLNDRTASFFAALLYAVHPVQWEAVCNIAGRSMILNGFFTINAFLLFCLMQQKRRSVFLLGLSLIFAFLALLAKESAAMLPALIFAYLVIFREDTKRNFSGALIKTIPYGVVVLAYIMIRKSLGITEVYVWRSATEFILGFLTFLRASLTYLRLFILPVDLHFDRSRALFTNFLNVELLATVFVFVMLFAVFIKYRKKLSPGVLFFLCWFWIELFPVSQIVASIGVQPGFISTAEHFLYTASVGIFALLVMAFGKLYQKNKQTRVCSPKVFQMAVACVIIFFMLATVQQTIYAKHTLSMIRQSIMHNPHNARMLHSLGFEMAQIGEFKKAEEYFRRSLAEEPGQPIALIGLGKSLCDQNLYAQCIREYEKVTHPGKFKGLLEENLELSYTILIDQYKRKIAREPGNPEAHLSLGLVYAKIHRLDEAVGQFEKAVALDGNDKEALFYLASHYQALGQKDAAIHYYEQLLALEAEETLLDEQARSRLNQLKN